MIKVGKHTVVPEDFKPYPEVNVTIGNFCSIGSGLKIYSGTHAPIEYPDVVSTYPFAENWKVDYPPCKTGGFFSIGHDVWIATDVRILEGVTIGTGAIIAAGSIVTKDVPLYGFVAGNPAQVKRMRYTDPQIDLLLRISWWNWSDEKIRESIPYMQNIKLFLNKYYEN